MIRALALLVGLWIATTAHAETYAFPSSMPNASALKIEGSGDIEAIEPLIRDFQSLNPTTAITYVDTLTNDLFTRVSEACARGEPIADLVFSSSVDHMVKLANDGCAAPHASADTARAPAHARWRDEVFGFTFEPAVIAYNYDAVPPEDVPRTRVELAELLRSKENVYRGRIGTYDPRRSGIGYLLTIWDARQTSAYGRLIESFGRARTVVHCCTSELLDELERGRLWIGYNLLGSYAYARIKARARLRLVLPRDYTVVLSRGAMIPAVARRPALASAFVEFILSPEGQRISRERAFFFSIDGVSPAEVDGPSSIISAGLFRPITIGPSLLAVYDEARRTRFLAEWTRSVVTVPARD